MKAHCRMGDVEREACQNLPGDKEACCAEHAAVVRVGVPSEPDARNREAVKSGHLRDVMLVTKRGHTQRVAQAVLTS